MLTETDMSVLRLLESGEEIDPVRLARSLGFRPAARGNFYGCFKRVYHKGVASMRVTRDAYFYRITPAGRAALAQEQAHD